MSIDRSNYEIFFLDYYEGNLPPEIVEELMAFLQTHPELKAEFDEFELLSLPGADQAVFEGKEMLKRGVINRYNYEWYFAAYAEGDLSSEEAGDVDRFATSNPDLQRELQLIEKARLRPEQNIVFGLKGSIKRGRVVPFYRHIVYYGAAAAVMLLMVILFFTTLPRPDSAGLADLTPGGQPDPPAHAGSNAMDGLPPTETYQSHVIEPEPKTGAITRPYTVFAEQQAQFVVPEPDNFNAGRMEPRPSTQLAVQKFAGTGFDPRTEFAYWHLRNRVLEHYNQTEPSETNFFQLAFESFRGSLRASPTGAGQQANEERPNLILGLAGVSIAGLNELLGSPVNIYAGRDENGRLVQLAFGNAIEINRK